MIGVHDLWVILVISSEKRREDTDLVGVFIYVGRVSVQIQSRISNASVMIMLLEGSKLDFISVFIMYT